MKKIKTYDGSGLNSHLIKLLRVMKITCLFLMIALVQVSASPTYSQSAKLTFALKNVALSDVFEEIENNSEFHFFYNSNEIDLSRKVTINASESKIDEILSSVFTGSDLSYEIFDRYIIIKANEVENSFNNSISQQQNSVSQQQNTVSGIVKDKSGQPLPGVTVVIKGTTSGTSTDRNGAYSISVPNNQAVLQFSSIGFKQQEITVGAQTTIDIVLEESAKELDEIVITALGIPRASKSLGYAASTVQINEITQNRTTNVMKSLEGKIAGMEIAPPTAGAGSSTRIRLRGQSGFAGQVNSPLIVINGLPMDQGARSAEGAPGIDQGDNLQLINQDDIESMTVLKGATAAALYGSRASNGAIIITTKSGAKNSQFGVEITSNFGVDEVLDYHNFQTIYGTGRGGKRPTTQAEAIAMGNQSWGEKHDGVPTIQYDGVLRPYSADENRIKEFYRTGTSIINTVALTGGSASTSYRASFSNQDITGITPENSYHKRIFNLGLNSDVTEKLTLQVNINYAHENNDNPPIVGVQGISYTSFLTRMPLTLSNETLKTSVVDEDGAALNIFNSLLVNPYFFMGRMFNYSTRDRFLGTASLRYDFTKWLYLQGRVNADLGYNKNERNFPHGAAVPLRNDTNTGWRGTYNVNTGFSKQINSDFLLGTTHIIGDLSIDASLGGNIWTVYNENTSQGVTDFVVRDIYSIGNGVTKNQDYGISRRQVNSLYAFADFGFKDILYLNLTDRIDYFSVLTPPSSVIAKPKNSFNYYSVGASFIFSELLNYSMVKLW